MIKYIVFDFDGTLADTFKTVKRLIEGEIDGISDEDFEILKEEGMRNFLKKKKVSVFDFSKMVLKISTKLKKEKDIKFFPGMADLIKTLSKSYKIGIVSSSSEEVITRTLKAYNIYNFFEFIFSDSSIFGKHKVLKNMCQKYQIEPGEIIYVGDEDRDIIASQKNNFKNIAVSWGYNSEKRLRTANPDFVVNYPEEIFDALESFK